MKRLALLLSAMLLTVVAAAPALAYDFRSTNAQNCADGNACVTVVGTAPGSVTLDFTTPNNYASCFEYRSDGDTDQATGDPNFNGEFDELYPFLCIGGPAYAESVTQTFTADQFVEIRSVFGAESDQYFDWTAFDVGQNADPATKDDCRNGGFADFGFDNQGQCIRFVNTGKDSRG